MGEIVPFSTQSTEVLGGQLAQAFESEGSKVRSIKSQLRTTVSQLAILVPSIFMKETDAAKMIQMLEETRNEIHEKYILQPLMTQLQQEAANMNQSPQIPVSYNKAV